MMKPLKHICGQCAKKFRSEGAYLMHLCEASGYNPRQVDNLIPVSHLTSQVVFDKRKAQLSEKEILQAVVAARRGKG